MQKKVLAAVIGGMLVAPAVFADSANVVISGRISGGFELYKVSGGTAAVYANEQRVSDQSSSLVFSGSEDLGGGLKGVFQVDNRFGLDTGSFGATGNTFVGLSGGFGRVILGRHDLHYHEANVIGGISRSSSLQSWIQPGALSQVNGQTIAVGSRTPNAIIWDSNNMGGVTARVAYVTSWAGTEGSGAGATDAGKDGAMTAALRWTSGPLTLGASYWDGKAEGDVNQQVGDQRSIRGWGGYTFGAITVGLAFDSSENRFSTGASMMKRTAFAVPVTFKSGSETFVASIGKFGKTSGGLPTAPLNTTTHDQTDASAISLGWDHALSKRTSVGASYIKLTNKANASYDLFAIGANGGTATAPGEDVAQLYFGVAHFY